MLPITAGDIFVPHRFHWAIFQAKVPVKFLIPCHNSLFIAAIVWTKNLTEPSLNLHNSNSSCVNSCCWPQTSLSASGSLSSVCEASWVAACEKKSAGFKPWTHFSDLDQQDQQDQPTSVCPGLQLSPLKFHTTLHFSKGRPGGERDKGVCNPHSLLQWVGFYSYLINGWSQRAFFIRMMMLPDIWKLLQIFLEEPLNISATC